MKVYSFIGICLIVFLSTMSLSAQDTTALMPEIDVDRPIQQDKQMSHLDTLRKELTDTIGISQADSILLINKMRLNPKKAGLYSALIPGGGQMYNGEYWKLPIVYGAIGTGIGFIIHNNKNYKSAQLEYSKRLSLKTDLNPKYANFDMYMLEEEQNYYKEYLDMSVLLTSLGYILQIMDAVAFNHLKGFDISPDISLRFKMSPLQYNQVGIGFALSLK